LERRTDTFAVGADLEALEALALEGTHCVDAGPVIADRGRALTLVHVDARVVVSREHKTCVADTLERALEIVANAMLAHAWSLAFVNVCGEKNN
jgi:hypothetical protein